GQGTSACQVLGGHRPQDPRHEEIYVDGRARQGHRPDGGPPPAHLRRRDVRGGQAWPRGGLRAHGWQDRHRQGPHHSGVRHVHGGRRPADQVQPGAELGKHRVQDVPRAARASGSTGKEAVFFLWPRRARTWPRTRRRRRLQGQPIVRRWGGWILRWRRGVPR
ncbi:unnamed protein product, partial [Ectocarpus fasciculatus]